MSAVRDPNELQRAVEGAAAALSRATGVPVELTRVVSLADDERRNLILRASAIRPDAAPRSVIVKATRDAGYDPAAPDAFEKSAPAQGMDRHGLARPPSAGPRPQPDLPRR